MNICVCVDFSVGLKRTDCWGGTLHLPISISLYPPLRVRGGGGGVSRFKLCPGLEVGVAVWDCGWWVEYGG